MNSQWYTPACQCQSYLFKKQNLNILTRNVQPFLGICYGILEKGALDQNIFLDLVDMFIVYIANFLETFLF